MSNYCHKTRGNDIPKRVSDLIDSYLAAGQLLTGGEAGVGIRRGSRLTGGLKPPTVVENGHTVWHPSTYFQALVDVLIVVIELHACV